MTPPSTFHLSCLLCGDEGQDLVAMQAHGMTEHGITPDQLRLARRNGPFYATIDTDTGWGDLHLESYTWTLPDGREWLGASRRRTPPEGPHAS